MKFSVNREEFIDVLSLVARVVSPRSPQIVLQGVKFSVGENGIELQATDLELAVRAKLFPISCEGAQEFVIMPNKFLPVLREISDKEISLEAEDADLVLKCGEGEFRFRRLGAEDFPVIHAFPEDGFIRMAAKPLCGMFEKLTFCAGKEKGRYAINGVYLNCRDGSMDIVATDGRRLGICTHKSEDYSHDIPGIILLTRLIELLDLEMKKLPEDGAVLFHTDERHASFKVGDIMFTGRLIEGEYPMYMGVIPTNLDKSAVVGYADFVHAIKIAAIFTDELNRVISIKMTGNSMSIASRLQEQGQTSLAIPVEYEGDEILMGFIPTYIQEYLKVIDVPEVHFKFTSSKRAVLFENPDDDYSYRYVLMPVEIKDVKQQEEGFSD